MGSGPRLPVLVIVARRLQSGCHEYSGLRSRQNELLVTLHVDFGHLITNLGFGMLLAAYSWRRRSGRSARWPYRWAPLIAAVALLALIGTGGEHTDVLAHLTGFFAGTVFGVVYGSRAVPGSGRALTQLLAGASTLAVIVGAWLLALTRA